MEDIFDICDGHIWFFPTFPMEISYRFEDFRLDFFSKDGNPQHNRSFPIIFPLQRMEILEISKISDYIAFSKDGNPRHFESEYTVCIPIFKERKSLKFTAKNIMSDKVLHSFQCTYYRYLMYSIDRQERDN
jgi:hypothetical protein